MGYARSGIGTILPRIESHGQPAGIAHHDQFIQGPALLLVQGIAAILQYGLILAGAKPVTGDSAEAGAND